MKYDFKKVNRELTAHGGDFIAVTRNGFYVSSHFRESIQKGERWDKWYVLIEVDAKNKAIKLVSLDSESKSKGQVSLSWGYGTLRLRNYLSIGRYALKEKIAENIFVFTYGGPLKGSRLENTQ